jgi:hypothetical protein
VEKVAGRIGAPEAAMIGRTATVEPYVDDQEKLSIFGESGSPSNT